MNSHLLLTLIPFLLLPAYGQNAATLVAQGRILFEQRKILQANDTFAAAVQAEPQNPAANAFYAVTRLLVLSEKPSMSIFLDRLGFDKTNRSVLDWTAEIQTDTNGIPVLTEDVNAAEAVTLIRTNLIPEIQAALMNLQQIQDPAFVLNLTMDEAFGAGPLTIDYGDIQLARSLLEFTSFSLFTLTSWNFDLQLRALRSMYEADDFNVEQILNSFPRLLTLNSTNDYDAARAALNDSISTYQLASHFIRSRPTNATRLFNFDLDYTEDEREFRTGLAELQESLSKRVVLSSDTNIFIHAETLFDRPISPRSLLPKFIENSVLAGSFPDLTLGGAVLGLDPFEVESGLDDFGSDVVPNFQVPERLPNGRVRFLLKALHDEFFVIQVSTDLRIWTDLTNGYSREGVITFEDSQQTGNHRYYRATDRNAPSVVIYAPSTLVELMAQSLLYSAQVNGQAVELQFPSARNYELRSGGITETGTITGATRTDNTWTLNLSPAAGQQGARGGVLHLTFIAADVGTWEFTPAGGQVEAGTFTVATSNGGADGGTSHPNDLSGRALQISYAGGGGERFDFTSATGVSWESGTATGTYTYNQGAANIDVALADGQIFDIQLGELGAITVLYQGIPGIQQTFTGTYTLIP